MEDYPTPLYFSPAVGVKMRALLGIELGRQWFQIAPRIYRSVLNYIEAEEAERMAPKPRERRSRCQETIRSIDVILRSLADDDPISLELPPRSRRGLQRELEILRARLITLTKRLLDLRGRPPRYALAILATEAALLLFLFRQTPRPPKHREHHAFTRAMLQGAGVISPKAGLADTCKDTLVRLKRQGFFGKKRRKLLSYLP